MVALQYTIDNDIFEVFGPYERGVVLAGAVENGASPAELIALLRAAEAAVCRQIASDALVEDPRIARWRTAFREFGARPSDFRASVEAMVRRVLKGAALPTINRLVDIGNVVSLCHIVPVGAHAIDVVTHDLALRRARGAEWFVPFGGDVVEHPLPGEVIFAEDDTVLTRRWTWRQAQHTLVVPETTAVEFNVDLLGPAAAGTVEAICRQIAELVEEYCGGRCRIQILTREAPSMSLAS